MPAVSESSAAIGELPVFWRSAPKPTDDDRAPVLYLHGVPSHSQEWIPFLERTGGFAPDLPGFGLSGKPGHYDYSIPGYERFLEQFLEIVALDRVQLVVHDWGAVGLAFAQRHPQRIERLVIANAVPFLPGYRWHRTARLWRAPLLGELAMGCTTKWVLKRATIEANVTPGPLPPEWLQMTYDRFDHGTQRAILRLYRSAPPAVLEQEGAQLGSLHVPALVVWGMQDPYLPGRFAAAYAEALPEAELLQIEDAGHWWWLDRPDLVGQVAEFLGAP